ncbi:MAG: hypothetical protein ACOVRN_19200 [Flavobacterium sp.]
MSTYVSVENQTLLWNTIQKVQLLHEQIPEYQQKDWFKQILGMFYQNIKNTSYDLRQLNKDTIGYMISTLKPKPEPEPQMETKPNSKFGEPISDTAIENMDELLKQQMKQRELDVVPFQPSEIAEMRRAIKQLQEDVALLKKLIPETKEVTE